MLFSKPDLNNFADMSKFYSDEDMKAKIIKEDS